MEIRQDLVINLIIICTYIPNKLSLLTSCTTLFEGKEMLNQE